MGEPALRAWTWEIWPFPSSAIWCCGWGNRCCLWQVRKLAPRPEVPARELSLPLTSSSTLESAPPTRTLLGHHSSAGPGSPGEGRPVLRAWKQENCTPPPTLLIAAMHELARAELGSSAWGWTSQGRAGDSLGVRTRKSWRTEQPCNYPDSEPGLWSSPTPTFTPSMICRSTWRSWSSRPNAAESPWHRTTRGFWEKSSWGPSINSVAEVKGLQGKICVQKGLCVSHCVTLQLPWWDFSPLFFFS